MNDPSPSMDAVLAVLRERAKELNCLYHVEELVKDPDQPLLEVMSAVVNALPPGWQHPELCCARIRVKDQECVSDDFRESLWAQHEDIAIQGQVVGVLSVYYRETLPATGSEPFLEEERRLMRTVADRLGHFILHQELRHTFLRDEQGIANGGGDPEWRVALNLLSKTDRRMVEIIQRKLLHHLCGLGIDAARRLLSRTAAPPQPAEEAPEDPNVPVARERRALAYNLDDVLSIAAAHVPEETLLSEIHRWIVEDKTSFLLKTLIDERSPIAELTEVVARYERLQPEGVTLSPSASRNVVVALVRRLLTDQLDVIRNAKDVLRPEDFFPLLPRIICTPESRGQLGGKSAGLFLAASILRRAAEGEPALAAVRTPKTFYLPADGILKFITYNNLEDSLDLKYRAPEQVQQEYDFVVHVFKNSWFPPEVVRGVTVALDELHDGPLVVRSSSLLEDRSGNCFPGKYKSLFLANRGTKRERRDALLDAIAEVYASTFGPDPIEYRSAHGLTDFDEQMGIMIQEVVGTRVGRYFLPLCAGVAFGRNDFRWSPRIARDDGMVRLVPGLGTRAVDRVGDDYPILAAPGQPELRVNTSQAESARYSPRKIDVIDLESGRFVTLPLQGFLSDEAHRLPGLKEMVSVRIDDALQEPLGLPATLAGKDLVVTFEGLFRKTPFLGLVRLVLQTLENHMGGPVDVEFAWHEGTLYLLQCRLQSAADHAAPDRIPTDVPPVDVVFSAARHVSNGHVAPLSHVVYVDADGYAALPSRSAHKEVARAVGALNHLLPGRRFALLGPGRWGSRGDTSLGVPVKYADIHNAGLLAEVASQQGNYVPELSFGTHFFQDLVEARIPYLPLYPDDEGVAFNRRFLQESPNALEALLPQFAHLAHTLRVIDVPEVTGGKMLAVRLNGEEDRALAFLVA